MMEAVKFNSFIKHNESLLTAIFFWMIFVFYDIIIVQYYWDLMLINPSSGIDYDIFIRVYWVMTFGVLIPAIITYATIKSNDLKTAVYAGLLMYGGTGDILWFVLQGKVPPTIYGWLWGGVTREFVIIVSTISLSIVLVIFLRSNFQEWKMIVIFPLWIIPFFFFFFSAVFMALVDFTIDEIKLYRARKVIS